MHGPETAPSRRAARSGAVRVRRLAQTALLALLSACATPQVPDAPEVRTLSRLMAAGDLPAADSLIARHPDTLDARRALDLALRDGHVAAVRHYLPSTGPDAELDPDGSTPLIRALRDAPMDRRAELVALLRRAGADPALADRYGRDARDHATLRASPELLALLEARPSADAGHDAALAAWLGATQAGTPAATPGPATRETPPALTRDALLRGSPWRPAALGAIPADRVALRFHGDGTADVLRMRAGRTAPEPMTRAGAAWRLERGRLLLSIVGEPFAAVCAGQGSGDSIPLVCTGFDAPSPRDALHATDVATALLIDPDEPPPPPSLLAIAMGRVSWPTVTPGGGTVVDGVSVLGGGVVPAGSRTAGAAARSLSGAGAGAGSPRLATVLGPVPAAAGECRPARARPVASTPAQGAVGDWYVLDTARFAASAPLSGWACTQAQARHAALQACQADGGSSTSCRSVGGCPVGRVSALAGLPGVDAGWVACGGTYAEARALARAACREDLGCDCQLIAVSGANLGASAGGARCIRPSRTAARGRRTAAAGGARRP
jgi:hypothetical protein